MKKRTVYIATNIDDIDEHEIFVFHRVEDAIRFCTEINKDYAWTTGTEVESLN
ncbi:hypothetical protein [Parabacteroides johnsonii]